jgi:hypothetical protein
MLRFIQVILLIISAFHLNAQTNIPIVKATSKKAYFIEGTDTDRRNWNLDPKAKPDVHIIDKISKSKWIVFHTDIDFIRVKINPGQKFDFIVLLNGKDSCYTQIVSEAPILKYKKRHSLTPDTLPFVLSEQSNLIVKVLLNSVDTLNLLFDTGATGLLLTEDAIEKRTNLLKDQINLKDGTKTLDFDNIRSYNTLKIGNLNWDSLKIWPVVVSGHGTDGRFGWDLFDGRVVEMDFELKLMIIHDFLPEKRKEFTKLNMEYTHELFCIQGDMKVNNKVYSNRFLFDSGYQRALLLDSILMQEQHFPRDLKLIKTNKLTNGQGKVFVTKIINCDQLAFGNCALNNIPTQLLSTTNPARFKTHILGNEFLKRFNTILDFQGNKVYLKPNSLINEPYTDAS